MTAAQCPTCGAPALHPAVMPNYRRHCGKCGTYFMPETQREEDTPNDD